MSKVITPKGRLNWVAAREPRETPNGAMKYSCQIMWPKGTDLSALEAAIQESMETQFGTDESKWPGNADNPLRDGDVARSNDSSYAGMVFINAKSDNKPDVAQLQEGKVVQMHDPDELYSGCYGALSVSSYGFDKSGNKGVAFGLNNILKTGDGERLDGRKSAEEDFGTLETEFDDDIPF